jgi:hypothetical protein
MDSVIKVKVTSYMSTSVFLGICTTIYGVLVINCNM